MYNIASSAVQRAVGTLKLLSSCPVSLQTLVGGKHKTKPNTHLKAIERLSSSTRADWAWGPAEEHLIRNNQSNASKVASWLWLLQHYIKTPISPKATGMITPSRGWKNIILLIQVQRLLYTPHIVRATRFQWHFNFRNSVLSFGTNMLTDYYCMIVGKKITLTWKPQLFSCIKSRKLCQCFQHLKNKPPPH